MTKHTQGPWRSETSAVLGTSIFSRETVVAILPVTPQLEANAALIAAAPDLLEALKEALTAVECWCDDWGGDPQNDEQYIKIKAVINKAENNVDNMN